MKIDFGQPLTKLDGSQITDPENKTVTLRFICMEALMATFEDERGHLSGEDKMKRFELARDIFAANGGQLDVTAENIGLLKSLIGKGYGPLVVGQAWKMLEGQL